MSAEDAERRGERQLQHLFVHGGTRRTEIPGLLDGDDCGERLWGRGEDKGRFGSSGRGRDGLAFVEFWVNGWIGGR